MLKITQKNSYLTVESWFNWFTTGGIPADAKGATMADRISRGYFGSSYLKIEAKITFFFGSKIINLLFNGLAYNTGEHFLVVNVILTDGGRMFSENSYQKIEANGKITFFFCSGIINLLFDSLA